MPLQHDLTASARRWAANGLDAFAATEPDHDFAVYHMATAVEHLSKAYLCSISGVLLVCDKPTVEDLLVLAGRTDKTTKRHGDVKPIGGADAIGRAEKVFGRPAANADGLRRLREIRNGVTRLAQGDDPSKARALLAAGIAYINDLLRNRTWRYPGDLLRQVRAHDRTPSGAGRHRTGAALPAQTIQVARIVRPAVRHLYEAAREVQIKALSEAPLRSRWFLHMAATCPACSSPAVVSGRDFSEDFGSYFAPRFFGCRVCELRLEGAELELAGFQTQLLRPDADNSFDPESFEPDEDPAEAFLGEWATD